MVRKALTLVAALLVASCALAQSKPLGVGAYFVPQGSAPGPAGKIRLWFDAAGNLHTTSAANVSVNLSNLLTASNYQTIVNQGSIWPGEPALTINGDALCSDSVGAATICVFSPLTNKGDLRGFDGSAYGRLGAGANGQVLTADSTSTLGWKWAAGGRSLATTYAAGASSSDSTLTIDSTRLGLRINDAVSPVGVGGYGLLSVNGNGGSPYLISDSTGLYVSNSQLFSGAAPTTFKILGQSHAGLTPATEFHDFYYAGGRIVQWTGGGSWTAQRFARFGRPTMNFTSAATVPDAATVSIDGAPIAGTNATLTNTFALWVQSGIAALDGGARITGNVTGTYTLGGTPTATAPIGASLGATTISSPWIAVSGGVGFANTYIDYGAPFSTTGYYKDALGVVHVRLAAKGSPGVAGATIFTLPVGYRPAATIQFPALVDNLANTVIITAAGLVGCSTGGTTHAINSIITFPAEN